MDKIRKRCSECKTKVGLLGFTCRCKDTDNKCMLFCSVCKIPKQTTNEFTGGHVCTFDYRSYGRELFEKNNPIIQNSKIETI
jgi:hypothetical protein